MKECEYFDGNVSAEWPQQWVNEDSSVAVGTQWKDAGALEERVWAVSVIEVSAEECEV